MPIVVCTYVRARNHLTTVLLPLTMSNHLKLFVKEDPYVEAGIVTDHKIVEWNVVVSKDDN